MVERSGRSSSSPDGMEAPYSARALADLGVHLRRARKMTGLTIAMAATAAGLDASYLGELERGRKNVSFLTLVRLVGIYGVELASIFGKVDGTGGEGSPGAGATS